MSVELEEEAIYAKEKNALSRQEDARRGFGHLPEVEFGSVSCGSALLTRFRLSVALASERACVWLSLFLACVSVGLSVTRSLSRCGLQSDKEKKDQRAQGGACAHALVSRVSPLSRWRHLSEFDFEQQSKTLLLDKSNTFRFSSSFTEMPGLAALRRSRRVNEESKSSQNETQASTHRR